MGQIIRVMGHSQKQITNWAESNDKSMVKFMHIFLSEENNRITILDEASVAEQGSSHNFALKDVEYTIKEGIIYIRGTRMEYHRLRHFLRELEMCIYRPIYTIWNDKRNQELETPIVPTEIIIKRWWRSNKKVMGIDNSDEHLNQWYKIKKEKPFEIAISNFILKEK